MTRYAFKCSSWLNAFLARRGIKQPDQRSLYEYHCSYEEYCDLQRLLRELSSAGVDAADRAACACLVLFCSEWYRREYKREHGWSWDPIFNVLGFNLSAVELSKIIPKGLEGYWKRPIHYYESERRDFLGSVFSEGGLPFQVLREGGSRFQTLFDRLLKQHDQARFMGYTTLQLVEHQLEKMNLPKVFSSRTSLELVAKMTDQLVDLVQDFALDQCQEPVARLDTVNPNWRQIFPLPLDNETGSELLNGLLKTATNESKKRRKVADGLACQHFWFESKPEALKVLVSLPEEQVLPLLAQPSTTRFELAIMEGDQAITNLIPSYALVGEGTAKIRLRQREVVTWRRDFTSTLNLVAMAGGVVVAALPISGSSVALGEMPVGFEPADDGWQLCGQASFSIASEDLLLVLPANSKLGSAEPNADLSMEEALPVCSFRAVKIRGCSTLRVECEEVYRIRTGHSKGAGGGVEFTGTSMAWSTKPVLTFLGLPRIQWSSSIDREAEPQGGELYVAGKALGSGTLQEMFGSQYMSVRNQNGETLLRRKVGILPADFRLELRSGNKPGRGSILIYSRQPCLAQVADNNLQITRTKKEDHTELELVSSGFPPAKVRLTVTPNLVADPVEIDLPFPNSGCLAFDRNGKALRPEICVEDLLGARLYLFGRNGASTTFGIELTLKGNDARNASYSWSYTVADKPLEISLFNIREQIEDLLSLHSGIDQTVEMRVFGGVGSDTYFRIRKYSTVLKFDREKQLLSVFRMNGELDSMPEPVLMLLHEPMRTPAELVSRVSEDFEPNGEFQLPEIVTQDGPWLVVPKSKDSLPFRPVYIPGGQQPVDQEEEIHSLEKAVLFFDHSSAVSSFVPVLDAMAVNPMHSGWQFLRSLYDGYGYLPLATFEVWKALVRNSQALAMALFKFEMMPQFLSRLEAEFPFFWEFISFRDIQVATQRFSSLLKDTGISEQVVTEVIERMLDRLGNTFPSFGDHVQRFLVGKSIGPELQMPHAVFKVVIQDWYRQLIRERSAAQWPEYGGRKLEHWHRGLPDSVISFKPEMSFRNAVVYLPVFAAAVASGKVQFSEVFGDEVEAVFFLRQVRNFDSTWFNAVYQYCLLNNVMNMEKASEAHG